PKANWSTRDDEVLIEVLESLKSQYQSDSGWKAPVWLAAAERLAGSEEVSGGGPKGSSSCQDRFGTLKTNYITVKTLRDLSGFGWDSVNCIVTAPDSVWDTYIASHPKAAKWRKKTFPLFDEMAVL
ncbi:hypothetical protein FA95DRAFT_1454180, partial [Auriscalpium vulgare]